MNRKLISKAISDIDDSFLAEAMSQPVVRAGHTPERTSNMDKCENKRSSVNSRRLTSLILAACLIFTLAMTAFALNLFGIREMFRTKYRELPESADPYIQHHTEAAETEEWSARITESLCDPTRVMVTVLVTGGDKYIIVPTDANPECRADIIGIEADMTIGEYAAAQGKELLCVNASMRQNENLGIFTETISFESISDSEMAILVDAVRMNGETVCDAVCSVIAVNEEGEQDRVNVPVTLEEAPVSAAETFAPEDPNAIAGIRVNSATVEETPLGWSVRINVTVTDETAFENIKWMACEELTYFEGGGFVLEDDGTWSTIWSLGKGNIGDSLTVHYYDWDDQPIGDAVFKKK